MLILIKKMTTKEYLQEYYQKHKEAAKKYARDKRKAMHDAIDSGEFKLPDITHKICKKCTKEKPVSQFVFRKNNGNYETNCNYCRKIDAKRYRDTHRETVNQREKLRSALRRTDPSTKIVNSLRLRLTKCFRRKNMHTYEYLGMNYELFEEWIKLAFDKYYFTEGCTVENYGTVWELDHIVPCAFFDMQNENEAKMCFHWTNIQPLIKCYNSAKKDKISYIYISLRGVRLREFVKIHPEIDYFTEDSITFQVKKLIMEKRLKDRTKVKMLNHIRQSAAEHLSSSDDEYDEGSETKQVSADSSA